MSEAELLTEHIARLPEGTPERRAFLAGKVDLTHGEIRAQIARTRGLFAELGLHRGARIVIASADDAAVSMLYGATLTAGLTALVLDPRASAAELTVIVERVKPAAIFADDETVERSLAVSRHATAPVIRIQAQTPKRSAFGLLLHTKPASDAADRYPALLVRFDTDTPVRTAAAGDTALILFTSGTTSEPKGVELTFGNLGAQMATFRRHYGIDEKSVLVNHLPMHHSDGLHQGPLIALFTGATLVRPEPVTLQTLGRMLDLAYQTRATHLVTVPTVLGMMTLLPAEYDDSFRYGEFRFIASTAGPLDGHIWRAVEERFGVMVVNSFGLTETCSEALYCGPSSETRRIGTIGKPVDCEAILVNEDGEPVLEGEPGELWIRGDNVMRGYFEAPEATQEVLRDGWLRTGDIAVRDADGFYRIAGRIKSLILRGGVSVYPEDVTAGLLSCSEVAAAAVIGMPDPMLGERVIACVIPASETDLGLALRIMEHCREALAPEKVPDRVMVFDELPYGPSGKIEIAALKMAIEDIEAGQDREGEGIAGKVLSVAADIFAVERATLSPEGRLDDPSTVDSLRYLEFIMALERSFKIKLNPREIMAMRRLQDAIGVVEDHLEDAGHGAEVSG